MRLQGLMMDLVVYLLVWLPFELCGLTYLKAHMGERAHCHKAVAPLFVMLLPLCVWLPLCCFGVPDLILLTVMIAVMFLNVPVLARCTALPAGYTAYCLLAGIVTSVVMAVATLESLRAKMPPDGVVLALLLPFSVLWGRLCVYYLKKLVFPFREQLTSIRRFLIDGLSLIYLALALFFYYGGVVLFSGRLTILTKQLIYILCLLGVWDAYRRNARLMGVLTEYLGQRNRSDVLAQSLQLQQAQYAAMAEQAEIARALRHDLRHHQLMINQYIHDHDQDHLAEYIQEFQRQRNLFSEDPPVCKHPVADVLTRYYLGQMQRIGAELDVILEIDESCPVPGADLCVLLGNCLENAFEAMQSAGQGRRFLRMRGEQKSLMLTLVMENGYSGPRLKDEKGFLSTKRPGRGFGLGNIEAISQKYSGNLKVEARDGVFRLSVILFGNGDEHGTCSLQRR